MATDAARTCGGPSSERPFVSSPTAGAGKSPNHGRNVPAPCTSTRYSRTALNSRRVSNETESAAAAGDGLRTLLWDLE